MARSEATDRWHKATLAPGEEPCRSPRCRAATAPTADHGKGLRWKATWGEKIDGKRVQRSAQFRTREEASDYQRKMRTGIRDKTLPPGMAPRRSVVTVAGYIPEFMELTSRDRSAGSNGKVRSQLTRMIVPYLGHRDLAELQHDVAGIRQWQEQLLADYTASTIGEAFSLLKRMYGYAAGDRRTGVTVNPCLHPQARPGKIARKRNKRKGEWTPEKVAAAYLVPQPERAARGSAPAWPRYRTALLLAATTGGMRLEEVFALDTGDVDWGRQVITMNYSFARDHGGMPYFRAGKSEAAQRVMTAAPLALKALSEHMARYRPVTVALPLETAEMYGRPVEEWPVIERTLIFSTGSRGAVIGPVYQSACRPALYRAGLLPARPIESRAIRDEETGQYVANGGPQRPHHVSERYEKPTDHGMQFHAVRYLWESLMSARGIPLTVRTDEIGHGLNSTLRDDGGTGPNLTLDTYSRPVPGAERARWRQRIREIITEEFGPYLPDLLDGAETARGA